MRTVCRYMVGHDMDGCPMDILLSVGVIGYGAKARRKLRKIKRRFGNNLNETIVTVPGIREISQYERRYSPEEWNR